MFIQVGDCILACFLEYVAQYYTHNSLACVDYGIDELVGTNQPCKLICSCIDLSKN